jgi:hypothetical protein
MHGGLVSYQDEKTKSLTVQSLDNDASYYQAVSISVPWPYYEAAYIGGLVLYQDEKVKFLTVQSLDNDASFYQAVSISVPWPYYGAAYTEAYYQALMSDFLGEVIIFRVITEYTYIFMINKYSYRVVSIDIRY